MSAPDIMHTTNPTCDYEFLWTVENFSLTQNVLQGASFSPVPGFPFNLCLKLHFKQVVDNSMHHSILDVVLMDLNVKTGNSSLLTFSGSTCFLDTSEKCLSRAKKIVCNNFKEEFILLHFTSLRNAPVAKDSIFEDSFHYELLEDKLIVKGKLTFSGYDTATGISSLAAKDNSQASGELLKDLKTIYETAASSDITFSVGEKTLRAHKIILLSRSPVFAKMFETDMLEKNSNNVVVEDSDFDVFNCFLMFLYTGILEDKKWNTVLALYSLAHKYQVKSLHETCSGILGDSLAIDSACSVLVLSDLHGDEKLKNVARVFIRAHLLEIVVTTEWAEMVLSKPQLVKAVVA